MTSIADIAAYLRIVAPLELAEEWDNVGLLSGDDSNQVQRVMTCLTVTPQSAAEAIEGGAQLVVSHHPILFRAVKSMTAATREGAMLLSLIRAGVAVYSPHTAFDNAPGGINDVLAKRLSLTNVQPLRMATGAARCKVVVFVPEKDVTRVSEAMFTAGGGKIGKYSACSFRVEGKGTFFGSESTNPSVGQKGRREEVAEVRLEVVCPAASIDNVISALRLAHSYEEPAYDVYPLQSEKTRGAGRVGDLAQPRALADLANLVRAELNAPGTQTVGEGTVLVRRVAIVCGSGGDFWRDALSQQADVLLTGEARFHDCLAARSEGLAMVLPGHHASERCGVEELAIRLKSHFAALEVWASRVESDPISLR